LHIFCATVSPEGSVVILPETAVVEFGDTVIFNCSVQGGPNITYQWQRNEIDLPDETLDDLIIPDVGVEDGGNYTCIVRNAAGSDNSTSMLLVVPAITIQPVDQQVVNGSIASFTCEAESFPDPEYTWEKYNDENGSFNSITSGSVLQFMPAIFGNEGTYRCIASLPGTNRSVTSRPAVLAGKH